MEYRLLTEGRSLKVHDLVTEPEPQGKEGLFYGWVIVGVMAIARSLGLAMGTLNFGLFIVPMGNELGIGRSAFGLASSARTVTSAVTSPLMGRLIDRFGSRGLLAVGAALVGVALIGLGYMDRPWQMVLLFGVAGLVPISGPAALVTTVPVAKWFVRKRGRAVGWLAVGNASGAVALMPLTQVLIHAFEWRNAWIVLGGVGAAILIPLSIALVRRQPEDMGLAPDGDAPGGNSLSVAETGDQKLPVSREISWTVREAMASSTFWRLLVVSSMTRFTSSSVILHRVPNFSDRGLDAQLVAFSMGLEVAVAGISIFVLGYLTERLPARYLSGVAFFGSGVAISLTIIANSPLLLLLSMGAYGIGVSGNQLLRDYIWAEYFGRRYLGSIRGIVNPVVLTFSAAGPPLAGYVWDIAGSYDSLWWVSVVLVVFAAILLFLTPPPRHLKVSSQAHSDEPRLVG